MHYRNLVNFRARNFRVINFRCVQFSFFAPIDPKTLVKHYCVEIFSIRFFFLTTREILVLTTKINQIMVCYQNVCIHRVS